MIKSFNQFLFEAEDRSAEPSKETWTEWNKLINMTPAQIKNFREDDGKDAGLTSKEAEANDIDSGKESAEMLIKMI